MKWRPRNVLLTVVLMAALLGTWMAAEGNYAKSVAPDGVKDVAGYFQRFGEPEAVALHVEGPRSYYEFTGAYGKTWASKLVLPSGPPSYVFDDDGHLVDWCGDTGDAPNYQRRWPREASKIELAEVKRRFGL